MKLKLNQFYPPPPHQLIVMWIAIFFLFSLLAPLAPLVEASISPFSFLMSSRSGKRGGPYPAMKSYGGGGAMEVFDDGTPLSFYRQQVAKMHGGGGGHGGGKYGGGGGGGGHGGGKYGGGGGRGMKAHIGKLYRNSFKYPNMLMGGGFMKSDGFGPSGQHTSKKWRGYGRGLISTAHHSKGYMKGDKLTNVRVVKSGATDYYKDSYLTMITNTLKSGRY